MDNGADVFVNVRAKGEARIFWASDWEAERKIAHELADKAWELENLSPDGRFVKVRPTANYENIYYSLRYIYDKEATASPHPLGCG